MESTRAIDKMESGISNAEEIMEEFMDKLDNGAFTKETLIQEDEGFDPTNDEEAERILVGYQKLLEDIEQIKTLELK